jgi:hypothetical protein
MRMKRAERRTEEESEMKSVSWCSEDDLSEGFESLDQVFTPVVEW